MLEYSAAFSHLKIIGWHFEAGGGREGEKGSCLPKRRLEQRNHNDFQKLSFFPPFLLSLPLSRRADKRLGLMQFMVMSSWRGEPQPGGAAPSCPGSLLCLGTALLWLFVGNPEQGLPRRALGAVSRDLPFIWGQELGQGDWEGIAASSPAPCAQDQGVQTDRQQFGTGPDHPSCCSSMGPASLLADLCVLTTLDLISFYALSPIQ